MIVRSVLSRFPWRLVQVYPLLRHGRSTVASPFDDSLVGLFRISKSAIVLLVEDERNVAHTLPAGAIVEALDGRIGKTGLLYVVWEGRKGLMFAVDLRWRGHKVDESKPS
jgi:hypothetical protein